MVVISDEESDEDDNLEMSFANLTQCLVKMSPSQREGDHEGKLLALK